MNVIILDQRSLTDLAKLPYWTELIRLASIVALYDHVTMLYLVLNDRTGTCEREEAVSYSKLGMAISNLAWANITYRVEHVA